MPANTPVKEIGYTQAPGYNWWQNQDETTPELVWPQSIYVYDQMRRTDSQVGSVLRAVTETLLRTPWRIDPAGARARVVKMVADDLGLPIVGKKPTPPPRLKDRFSWASHLREALLMLPYGHSYFEQVYRVSDDGNTAHLRKLAYRPAKTIERIDVAPDGGLIAIKQYWTQTDTEPKPIPVDRLVAYIHAKEGGNWLGTSILRNCYKNWLLKDRLLRVQAQTIERNGMGIPLYTAAETEESLAAGLGMATSWRAGEAAGSAIPFGASLKLVGVEGTLPDAQPVIDYHDSQIARAVLAHFLNLGQQTGSWALGTTFADFFTMSLQTLAEQIRDTATQHIVEDLVDINFGENEPAPRLVFDEIGSRQAATAAALKTLVDAGILHPDQVLEESSRQQYGLPPADPATATPSPGATPTPVEPTAMGDLSVAAKYNPAQLRDPGGEDGGQWTKAPGPGGAPSVKDALRLADRIGLKNGETFAGSDTINAESGRVNLAWINRGGTKHLRLAAGDAGFAEDAHKWRASNLGHTVELDPDGTEALRQEFGRMVDRAKDASTELRGLSKEFDRFYVKHGEHPSGRAESEAWLSGLSPEASEAYKELGERADELADEAVAKGAVHGSWGTVRYEARMSGVDDPSSWSLLLGVEPRDAPDDWSLDDGVHGAYLSPGQAKQLARKLEAGDVQAAAGVDTHPGGEQLKHYWLHGEGAAKWSTWTELYHHLVKYLSSSMAKRTAAAWFHLRYGFWPGDHRNVHASAAGQADDEEAEPDTEADDWEMLIAALVAALTELSGTVSAAFDPAKHPRGAGGKFRSTVDKLKDAIQTHRSGGGKGDPFADFDREQLRRAAKTRGITLGRGEGRDSIAKKLLSDLDEQPPAKVAPKPAKRAPRKKAEPKAPAAPQPVKKATPRKAPQAGPRDAGRAELARVVESGTVSKETALAGGAVASIRLRTYDDGTKIVWKSAPDFASVSGKHQADAEELAPLVAHALGLKAPAVVRGDDERTVHMAFVGDAKSQAEIEIVDDSLPHTDEGRMVGLLDLLISNTDRNSGNVLVRDDGSGIVPIDHGLAFRGLDEVDPAAADRMLNSSYTSHYLDVWNDAWRDNDLTPADIAEVRQRLSTLQPDFDRLGHADWYEHMLGRLDAVAAHAKGTTPRLLPEVT